MVEYIIPINESEFILTGLLIDDLMNISEEDLLRTEPDVDMEKSKDSEHPQ